MAFAKKTPEHGTRARYVHRDPDIRCREACCKKANADYLADYRANGPWQRGPQGVQTDAGPAYVGRVAKGTKTKPKRTN